MTGNPTLDGYITLALAIATALLTFLGAVYVLLTALASIFAKTKAGPFFARWGADLRRVLKAAGRDPELEIKVESNTGPDELARLVQEEIGKRKAPRPPMLGVFMIALAFLLAVGCASMQQAKPALSIADQTAQYLCGIFHSKRAGISIQDAIDTSCDSLDKLRPFYAPIIALERAGLSGGSPESTGECAATEAPATFEPTHVYILVKPEDAGAD